ncbi:MAG: alanine dehydrogenase, partial [Planctomycetaceae bacterium]|nr:alanine dehydrogenase [Planctomycetaceae bacterium]
MIVSVAKEIKENEYRVALLPFGVYELAKAGHVVLVQKDAGIGAGVTNEEYLEAGAKIVESPAEIFGKADMVLKVKEPLPPEYPLLRKGQILFTYLHLAADKALTAQVRDSGCRAIAYETLQDAQGRLPLLTPMSEVAGRMSIQEGAKYLEKSQGGRGVLLGGVPGVAPAKVLILGGGIVGTGAARVAAGFGADVVILDSNIDRLRYLADVMPANVNVIYSNRHEILRQLPTADLVIGAVLIPGAKAPALVRKEDMSIMQKGAVIVDVAIDQGGCCETSRVTTHSNPTYLVDDVVHYCVGNMPGAVSRTSTSALCNATFPWVLQLANNAKNLEDYARRTPPIA